MQSKSARASRNSIVTSTVSNPNTFYPPRAEGDLCFLLKQNGLGKIQKKRSDVIRNQMDKKKSKNILNEFCTIGQILKCVDLLNILSKHAFLYEFQ